MKTVKLGQTTKVLLKEGDKLFSQGDVHYNISFYDELFDSSLDEKGVDLVLEILNERVEKYNECVMVISHRKESIKSANGDIIFLEKHNGITRRVNFID